MSVEPDEVPVRCGSALVMRLLPQRPPFLMVDRLDGFAPGPRPMARASRFVTVNEPYFAGHFPEVPVLPGALMLEGVGQTASLAYTEQTLLEGYRERGADLARLLDDLAALDAAFELRPGHRDPGRPPLVDAFERLRGRPVGVAGEVRLKFLRAVPPGVRLVYVARLTHRLGDQARFDVSAAVDGEPVLHGSLSAAIVAGPLLPPAAP